MSVGFGLLGSGFMAHTYAQSLAKHVPDGHLVAVAEGTRAPGAGRRVRRRPRRDRRGAPRPRRRRRGAHLHAALDPRAADRSRRRRRQARLHREADGGHAGRLRRDDRRLPRRAGVLLDVNHVTRHRASPVAAKGLIDDGSIGELRIVRILSSVDRATSPTTTAGRTRPARAARGWTWASTCSMRCAGSPGSEVEVIFAKVRDFAGDPNQRRSGLAEVVMRNGVIVQVLDQLRGARSRASARRASGRSSARTGSSSPTRTGRSGSGGATAGRTSSRCRRSRSTPTSTARSGWRRSPSRRSSSPWACRPASTPPPALHGEDGRAAVEVVEAGSRSSESGEAVHLPIDPA